MLKLMQEGLPYAELKEMTDEEIDIISAVLDQVKESREEYMAAQRA